MRPIAENTQTSCGLTSINKNLFNNWLLVSSDQESRPRILFTNNSKNSMIETVCVFEKFKCGILHIFTRAENVCMSVYYCRPLGNVNIFQ